MKKIICSLLMLVLISSAYLSGCAAPAAPAAIAAPDGEDTYIEPAADEAPSEEPDEVRTVGDFTIEIRGKKACIRGYSGDEEALSIPGSLDGYVVTGIDEDAFRCHYSLQSITIPDSVRSISNDAFENCDKDVVIVCSAGSYAEGYALGRMPAEIH